MDMLTIARQLPDIQLVLLCGHHEPLADRLRRLDASAPRAVIGYTRNVRRYMMLGDFFIGKPGPGSLSEALHMGLPVVTVRNAWTMPQERYNTEWVQAQGVGLVGASMRRIRPVVVDALQQLDLLRARVRLMQNQAVFEVPDILADLMVTSRCDAEVSARNPSAPATIAPAQAQPAELVG